MGLKFNPITSELDLVNPSYDPSTDTLHVLKAGDTMTGTLYNQGTGVLQQWQDSTPDFFAKMDINSAAQGGAYNVLRMPYSTPIGNLYLGQWEIGNNGITYCWDPSVAGFAYDALPVFRILRADYLTSGVVDAHWGGGGDITVSAITAPQYVTSDNGFVTVAMGFFNSQAGLLIHDTNGTSADYLQFQKNTGDYILQTTWDGQTTAQAYQSYSGGFISNVTALIARGYTGQLVDIFQIQAYGGTGGASGTVLARFDQNGNLFTPAINGVTLTGSSTPTLAVTGTSAVSGTNTGDQTITLTGDVTGSGTGSFATTIKTNVALAGNPTTTTQSAGDSSTKIATTAFVGTALAAPTASASVSLTAGTAYKNTSGTNVVISGVINVSAAVGGSINLGMGVTSTPTTQPISPALSTALLLPFTARVPNNYYLLIQTSGTITVGSITAIAT